MWKHKINICGIPHEIMEVDAPELGTEYPMGYLVCSVCGSHHRNSTPCNYCDNCGADMNGTHAD